MALHYLSSYSEASVLLDDRVYGDNLDIRKLEQVCEAAEARFDNEMRRYYQVPIDSTVSPEAFALAKKVVAYWAAADYANLMNQAEGDERDNWHAGLLKDMARVFLDQLKSHRVPDDVQDGNDPRVWILAQASDHVAPTALFTREQIVSGSSAHW